MQVVAVEEAGSEEVGVRVVSSIKRIIQSRRGIVLLLPSGAVEREVLMETAPTEAIALLEQLTT